MLTKPALAPEADVKVERAQEEVEDRAEGVEVADARKERGVLGRWLLPGK